jgi:hypothetical protein
MLRDAAWKEVVRLGLPPVKSDNPETQEKMMRRMQAAYSALQDQMLKKSDTPSKGDRKGIEAPSKLPNVNAHANAHGGEGAGAGEPTLTAECLTPSGQPLLCAGGCDEPAGPDGYCELCAKAQTW